jgi:hypothetical protein
MEKLEAFLPVTRSTFRDVNHRQAYELLCCKLYLSLVRDHYLISKNEAKRVQTLSKMVLNAIHHPASLINTHQDIQTIMKSCKL